MQKENTNSYVDAIDLEIKRIVEQYPDFWIPKSFERSEKIHIEDRATTHNFYVSSGILKAYISAKGNDYGQAIIGFFAEGNSIFPYRGADPKTALFTLEVISKEAEIYRITSDDWKNLRLKEPVLDELLQKDLIRIITRFVLQAKIRANTTSKKRYSETLKVYPYLKNIKDDDVAAYLGVSKGTIANIKPTRKRKQ